MGFSRLVFSRILHFMLALIACLSATSLAPAQTLERTIRAPRLKDPITEVSLDGRLLDLILGGGGRFLLAHLPEQGAIALFDVNEAKVVHQFSGANPNTVFAAGKTKLIVVDNDAKTITRHDLFSRKQEMQAKLPAAGHVRAMVMGHDSEGPLLLYWSKGDGPMDAAVVTFVDPSTLKAFEVRYTYVSKFPNRIEQFRNRDIQHFRAAADGSLITSWCTSHSPSGIWLLSPRGDNTVEVRYEHDGAGHLVPSRDGRLVFTGTHIRDRGGERPIAVGGSKALPPEYHPSIDGDYHLQAFLSKDRKTLERFTLHVGSDPRMICRVEPLDGKVEATAPFSKERLTTDRQIVFIPQAKMIVRVSPERDRLVLHRFDVDEAFAQTDELYILSQPTPSAQPQEIYRYQIAVKPASKQTVYKILQAPAGAELSEDGLLTWKVPTEMKEIPSFTIEVADSKQKKKRQTFRVNVITKSTPETTVFGKGAPSLLRVPPVADAIMSPDGRTLLLAVPKKGQIGWLDTKSAAEPKWVDVDFQAALLAVQKDRLFVAHKGAPRIAVLDLATGKQVKEFRAQGSPFQALACHPEKGLLYAVNQNDEVISFDPQTGKDKVTAGKGQLIVIDPSNEQLIYTGVQKPIRDRLVIKQTGNDTITVSLATVNLHAMMLKFTVDGDDLKAIAVNDNAAINGRGLGISHDGKRIAMAGGGGWRPKKEPRANYAVAFFDTDEMTSLLGQLVTGPYPSNIVFHPNLPYGVVFNSHDQLIFFRDRAFVQKEVFKVESKGRAAILFGAQGTKLIFINRPDGVIDRGDGSEIHLFDIPLTEEDRVKLKQKYPS